MDSDADINMSDDSRDTSPDPITLPSSPLGNRSARKSNDVRRPTPRRSDRTRTSRSKSVVMDTPQAGNTSPWRIRVTVEAEPRENSRSPSKRSPAKKSPSKKTRTLTIPLDDSRRSGSPVKRALSAMIRGEGGVDTVSNTPRVLKKRKGTPIRRGRTTRQKPQPEVQSAEETDLEPAPEPHFDDAVMPPPPVPAVRSRPSRSRRSSGRIGILNAQSAPALRSERLSMAREELDMALQDAVGYDSDPRMPDAVPGDATISRNEDFSMLSVDTLQTAKDTSISSILPAIFEGDRSTASVSQMVSAPPKAKTSGLRAVAGNARSRQGVTSVSAAGRTEKTKSPTPSAQLTSQQLGPTEVSQRGLSGLRQQVAQSEDEEPSDIENQHDNADVASEQEGADLWHDEASRSFEVEKEPQIHRSTERQNERSEKFEDLFAGQPLRPARDSPAHEPQGAGSRRHSTEGSGGVLTPPSTDGDSGDVIEDDYDNQQEPDPQSELTQPDAEATRYHVDEMEVSEAHSSAEEESSTQDSDGASNHDKSDNTGRSLENSRPLMHNRARRRPARKQTMDLTELLNLNGASSPAKAKDQPRGRDALQDSGTDRAREAEARPGLNHGQSSGGIAKLSPASQDKTRGMTNPFRSTKPKQNHTPGSDAATADRAIPMPVFSTRAPHPKPRLHAETANVVTDSFTSKASDQQQLLEEMQRSSGASHLQQASRTTGDNAAMARGWSRGADRSSTLHNSYYAQDSTGYSNETNGTAEGFRSYEERLNHDSPQKIPVNFNDTSSLLSLKRPFSIAFGTPSHTSAPKESAPQPGFLSRLTSTIWSAIVRPTGPTSIVASDYQLPVNAQDVTFSTIHTFDEETTMFNHDLRAHIRNRYGVLSNRHPWTMAHMRTLHRMMNSLLSQRTDSLIPNAGPLPENLARLINTMQISVSDYEWKFTADHAYVVFSFLQVLVDDSVLEAMHNGEVELLGDDLAMAIREYTPNDPRHGSENAFKVSPKADREGPIDCEFVVAALGCAVMSNDVLGFEVDDP
ncbi:hypothetical protein TI39_contig4191g00003 [Zymoseptoria brevis]|uniref:Uncharacterized protein n=1 Tax=Zymoseptoria brevis TaxID=1047168 RepID=A0A0F4GAQ3_9PEZI|nr:hypothetical protein TI39_contig4191g00003 [Zymoseptoria brevis]